MAGPTWRNIFKFLIPSWLSSGDGGLVLESLTQIVDDYSARARAALELRMPTRTSGDGLAELSVERALPRGRIESDADYAQRLLGWRTPRGHRVRGSAFALLDQIFAYFAGHVALTTRDVNGGYYSRAIDGTESVSLFNTWNWDNTLPAPNWGRFWVEISAGTVNYTQFSALPSFGDPTLYGGSLGQFGYCTGVQGVIGAFNTGLVGVMPGDFDAMRALFTSRQSWKPAGTRAEWMIINLDGVTPAPDGHYLHWSKVVAGVQVPARHAGHRYVALYAANNVYAGDRTSYCTSFTLAGGGTYAGNPASYPATITLPDGSTYAGNPNNYPATITLKDDGSPTT